MYIYQNTYVCILVYLPLAVLATNIFGSVESDEENDLFLYLYLYIYECTCACILNIFARGSPPKIYNRIS